MKDGIIYFVLKPGARMHFIGQNGGMWVRTTNVSFAMQVGNRPRQLEDGRILLIKRGDMIVDILSNGDVLDAGEINSK
jgi:hypothetical protein